MPYNSSAGRPGVIYGASWPSLSSAIHLAEPDTLLLHTAAGLSFPQITLLSSNEIHLLLWKRRKGMEKAEVMRQTCSLFFQLLSVFLL